MEAQQSANMWDIDVKIYWKTQADKKQYKNLIAIF